MTVPFCIGIIKPSKNVLFLYFIYLIMVQIFSVVPKGKNVMPLLMVRMSSKRRTQTIELKSIFVYPLIHISEELFREGIHEIVLFYTVFAWNPIHGGWPRCPPLFRQPLTKGSWAGLMTLTAYMAAKIGIRNIWYPLYPCYQQTRCCRGCPTNTFIIDLVTIFLWIFKTPEIINR